MRCLTFPTGPIFGLDGKIVPAGILVAYEPGTDNLKPWYLDEGLSTLAENPLRADSDGRVEQVYLGSGKYEIREYRPTSSLSVVPDDMTDFPQDDQWEFITSWICDGEKASSEPNIKRVDFVSELYALGEADADWVQVMNWEKYGDCYPRYFYYVTGLPPSADNGSTICSASDGGMWVLQKGAAPLDAVVFGINGANEDCYAQLDAACKFCASRGIGLYISGGPIRLATSGTIVAQCPIEFGKDVGFLVTNGAQVRLELHNTYTIHQETTFDTIGNGDFVLDLTQSMGGGDNKSVWWGDSIALALANCDRNETLYLKGDDGTESGEITDVYNSIVITDGIATFKGFGGEIKRLSSAGGAAKFLSGSIVIDELYTSALASPVNNPNTPNPKFVYVDEDVTITMAAYWANAEIIPQGGLINLTSAGPFIVARVAPTKAEVFGSYNNGGNSCSFKVQGQGQIAAHYSIKDLTAINNLANSNDGVADLGGFIFDKMYGNFDDATYIQNGTISGTSYISRGTDIILDHLNATFTYWRQTAGTLTILDSIFNTTSANGIWADLDANLTARAATINAPIDMEPQSDPNEALAPRHEVFAIDTEFVKESTFGNCNITFKDCIFDKVFHMEYPCKNVITGCESKCGSGRAFTIDKTKIKYVPGTFANHIVGNYPATESDANSSAVRWPQTEGYIMHEVAAADLAGVWATKWGSLSEAIDISDMDAGVWFDWATCERLSSTSLNGNDVFAVPLPIPRTHTTNRYGAMEFNFYYPANYQQHTAGGESWYSARYCPNFGQDYSLAAGDIVRVHFKTQYSF